MEKTFQRQSSRNLSLTDQCFPGSEALSPGKRKPTLRAGDSCRENTGGPRKCYRTPHQSMIKKSVSARLKCGNGSMKPYRSPRLSLCHSGNRSITGFVCSYQYACLDELDRSASCHLCSEPRDPGAESVLGKWPFLDKPLFNSYF